MTTTLGRTNTNGNVDLAFKLKAFQIRNNLLPSQFSIRLGAGWNTNFPSDDRKLFDSRNFQFYAQGIFNSLYKRTFGFGIVPTYLYNSKIYSNEIFYSFTFGSYAQVYLDDKWSLMVE